jgi:hypothetical protein
VTLSLSLSGVRRGAISAFDYSTVASTPALRLTAPLWRSVCSHTTTTIFTTRFPSSPIVSMAATKSNAKRESAKKKAPSKSPSQSKAPRNVPKSKQKDAPLAEDYPDRVRMDWKVGAHVSAAGGVENAILNAASIGFVLQSLAGVRP